MNTFAVYARVEITAAPEWLALFMKKYGSTTEPHVTLKQTCFIEEGEREAVREMVKRFFSNRPKAEYPVQIIFNSLRTKPDWDAILVDAEDSLDIQSLQKDLVRALASYRRYVEPELESYEKNFAPHLTIADGIPVGLRATLSIAVSEKFPFEIKGVIREIILAFGDGTKEAFPLSF